MSRNEYLGIGIVLLIGLVLGLLILSSEQKQSASDDHGHDVHGHGGHEHKGHDHDGHGEKGKASTAHDHGEQSVGKHEHEPAGHADLDDHDHEHGQPAKTQKPAASPQETAAGAAHANVPPTDKASADKSVDEDALDHGDHAHQPGAGPHGGRILTDGDLQLEISIYEDGVPPQFRVYCSNQEAPVDPAEVKLILVLRRPGGVVHSFHFRPEADYLCGDKEVEEPHSFSVTATAAWRGKTYAWEYAQMDGHVKLTTSAARAAGIEILTVGPQRVGSVFELPGEISFNADMLAHVVPRVAGVVSESLKNLGDPVKKGELIAVIESREMAEAKSRYLVFLKREELAQTVFERTESLWRKNVTAEQAYLNDKKALEEVKIEMMAAAQKLMALGLSQEKIQALAQSPGGPLNRYEVHAPFDGVVVKKHMAIGEWVTENKDLMVLADLATVWVEIIVYVKDLDVIRIGQKATVKSDASGLEATGEVSYVGPLVGEETRTARARVVISNPDGKWRPGLFVTVKLAEEQVDVPLAVRSDAVQMIGEWSVVFVRCSDGFEPRPVQLGRRNGKFVEVVQGLSPSERYAARNSFLLKSQLGIGGLSHSH
jgi:membrane fusion protein, heavy metal efflux system